MIALPVDAILPELRDALRTHRAAVVCAPPGSGKTTRIPPFLVRSGLLSAEHPQVLVLQPRRVAARAVAARIASENGWGLGREVGYHVRMDARFTDATRLLVMTEGILNRRLVKEPFLEGVGAVVLDEFHERSIHTDLAIALLREVQQTVRDDLRLIVMSATLDAGPIAAFLNDCPVIRAEGRTFPVTIEYAGTDRRDEPLEQRVASAVESVLRAKSDSGDVLVFLPGQEEIRRAGRRLESLARAEDLAIVPLHGSQPPEAQDTALRPDPQGGRKVVLATNVAETSLTIEGITAVVDSGLARFASLDPRRGLDRLELGRISRASADQRAGRAGRVAPGRCLRLWTERQHRGLAEFDVPDVRRVDLAGPALALHAWGYADLATFGWFEPPPSEAIEAADRLLERLGAWDSESRRLTPLGMDLLNFPAHPRIARLMVGACEEGVEMIGASLAALLSEKDILSRSTDAPPARPSHHGTSDVLERLDLFRQAERRQFALDARLDVTAARQIARVRDDLIRVLRRTQKPKGRVQPNEPDEETLLRLVMLAYPDRLVRRRANDPRLGVMVGGRGVRLDPSSVVRDAEFYLALDPREDPHSLTRESRVRVASTVSLEWLEAAFLGNFRRETVARFDLERRKVVGVSRLCYLDLVLREDPHAAVDPEQAGQVLGTVLAEKAETWVRGDAVAADWLDRLVFLRTAQPEGGWPEWTIDDLAEAVREVCQGCRSEDEARRVPLVPLLARRLTPTQARFFDTLAPASLEVPSGRRIKLDYGGDGGAPVLAVRLQELFGWKETPRLANGRVPVVVHLLGPNFRPVQITNDLKSFWATTYFQVRKDLRARYPKHAWPEDPLTARPEAKGTGRKS